MSFGAGWRALFDGVVFFARKGKGFFELPASETPFFRLKHDARTLPCGESVCPGGGAANELGERAGELELGGVRPQRAPAAMHAGPVLTGRGVRGGLGRSTCRGTTA